MFGPLPLKNWKKALHPWNQINNTERNIYDFFSPLPLFAYPLGS